MGFLRGAAILFGLATASFLLGFFVIARMMQKPVESPTTQESSVAARQPEEARPAPEPARSSAPPETQAPPPPEPRSAMQAPTIDPVEEGPEVQQPESLDDPGLRRNDNAPEESSRQPERAEGGSPSSGGEDDAHADTPPRSRQRAESPGVQTPGSLDSDAGNAPAPGTDTDSNATSGAEESSSSRYRVQIGVFRTRERADQEAEAARAKGFEISIVPTVTRSGRTRYRVQQGVYREKARADAALQSLRDAGFGASLIRL